MGCVFIFSVQSQEIDLQSIKSHSEGTVYILFFVIMSFVFFYLSGLNIFIMCVFHYHYLYSFNFNHS